MKYTILIFIFFSLSCEIIENNSSSSNLDEFNIFSVVVDSVYNKSANTVLIEDSTEFDMRNKIQASKTFFDQIFKQNAHEKLIHKILKKYKNMDQSIIRELITDYRNNNRITVALDHHFKLNRNFVLVPSDSMKFGTYNRIVCNGDAKKANHKIFKYYEDKAGIIKLSRPGFNYKRDMAIIRMKTSHCWHWDTYFIILIKVKDEWKLLNIVEDIKLVA